MSTTAPQTLQEIVEEVLREITDHANRKLAPADMSDTVGQPQRAAYHRGMVCGLHRAQERLQSALTYHKAQKKYYESQ